MQDDWLTKFNKRKLDLGDSFEEAQRKDDLFWWSLTPHERMQALQYMRENAFGRERANAPVERVIEIVDGP